MSIIFWDRPLGLADQVRTMDFIVSEMESHFRGQIEIIIITRIGDASTVHNRNN